MNSSARAGLDHEVALGHDVAVAVRDPARRAHHRCRPDPAGAIGSPPRTTRAEPSTMTNTSWAATPRASRVRRDGVDGRGSTRHCGQLPPVALARTRRADSIVRAWGSSVSRVLLLGVWEWFMSGGGRLEAAAQHVDEGVERDGFELLRGTEGGLAEPASSTGAARSATPRASPTPVPAIGLPSRCSSTVRRRPGSDRRRSRGFARCRADRGAGRRRAPGRSGS